MLPAHHAGHTHFYPRPPGGGRHPLHRNAVQVERISIHALRVEGDRRLACVADLIGISIHALRVEGDLFFVYIAVTVTISIHALRVEGDRINPLAGLVLCDFYPRPPGGGRPVGFTHWF